MGVILNRQANIKVKQIWQHVSDAPCRTDALIHLGGPCEGPLMAVHSDESLSDMEIDTGLYLSTESEKLLGRNRIGDPGRLG